MKHILHILIIGLLAACGHSEPSAYVIDVMNRYTPVKDQGDSNLCWAYAMLAAIETEHIMRGDSVNLSAAYVERMLEHEPMAPPSGRGMGPGLIYMIQKYGVVGYDAMRTADRPLPLMAYMLGCEYTLQEFARSVCAPGEYLSLTSDARQPYGSMVELSVPDNWTHAQFLNVPMDSLLARTERAVRRQHGVCWESRDHAMSIVGLAHDAEGTRYFVMKNSWGTDTPHGGLEFLSFDDFRKESLALTMTREAFYTY